ncbi:MAG TPA: hypothetical protein VGN09_26395 [Vicinamibacteria bacterium]|jgi:hypothetical protein
MALLALLLAGLSTGAVEVSDAPGSPPAEPRRAQIWRFGTTLALAASGHAQRAQPVLVERYLRSARALATRLGLPVPGDLPALTPDTRDPIAVSIAYLAAANRQISPALKRSDGPAGASLFELAWNSMILPSLYYPGQPLSADYRTLIEGAAKANGLDTYVEPVLAKVDARASSDDVRWEMLVMDRTIARYLAAMSDGADDTSARRSSSSPLLITAWNLGGLVTMAGLEYGLGRQEAATANYAKAKIVATDFGADISPLPPPAAPGEGLKSRGLDYAVATVGSLASLIERKHGPERAALLRLSGVIILMTATHDPGDTRSNYNTSIDAAVYGKLAGLPADLLEPFVNKTRANAARVDVAEATMSARRRIEEHLRHLDGIP